MEHSQSAFGIKNIVVRVPVTVLETDSTGQYTAIVESVEEQVIVSADRAVQPPSAGDRFTHKESLGVEEATSRDSYLVANKKGEWHCATPVK
ncbi:MAG: hypothetical protein H9882_06580 [Candidatus Fournierella pullistercoris]|uniref:Uncharacterized protein n=1 Tax=Candidatus Allofournierella pullistercoris TaxID=2838597 RepID=A0A948T376_9FIRM|nr:hypothetical protein [Candidatus Fournierella pullistercoris]